MVLNEGEISRSWEILTLVIRVARECLAEVSRVKFAFKSQAVSAIVVCIYRGAARKLSSGLNVAF